MNFNFGRGKPDYLAPETGWPLTRRQHDALLAFCEGDGTDAAAEWLGVEAAGARKALARALEALEETEMAPACFRLGRFEAKRDALRAIKRRKRTGHSVVVAIQALKAA